MSNYTANFDGGTTTLRQQLEFNGQLRANERDCIYWGFQLRATMNPVVLHQDNGFTSSYTTNNEAEYIALIKLLEHLVTISEIRSDRTRTTDSEINIYGDSKLVINQVFGDWKVKAFNLQRLNLYAKELVDGLIASGWANVNGKHMPRDFPEQSAVDKWAREALSNHKGGETI